MDETALTDTASKLMIEGISQMVRIEYESVKFSTTRKANPSVEKKKKRAVGRGGSKYSFFD